MSLSKEILFGNDPRYDAVRERLRDQISTTIDQFPFKVPARRKSRVVEFAYWDPIWPSSLDTAAKKLEVAKINVNNQLCFRTKEDADKVKEAAEEIWRERHKDHAEWVAARGQRFAGK